MHSTFGVLFTTFLISNLQSDYLLLEQIENDFKFFLRLHQISVSRPNVTPIVVTIALGPRGRKTVWYQPPDDEMSQMTNATAFTPTHSPSSSFGIDVTQAVVNQTPAAEIFTPVPATGQSSPKLLAISREAIEKARSNIEKVPQKCTLLDTLIEI
jgi:hypothetical protein